MEKQKYKETDFKYDKYTFQLKHSWTTLELRKMNENEEKWNNINSSTKNLSSYNLILLCVAKIDE